MRLPKPRPVDRQQRLFEADRLFTGNGGECRWATGQFFEDVTAEVSGAVRLRTDSRCDICPDVRFDSQQYGEVKAIGRGGSVIFYESRMQKDHDFALETGCDLVYWFWHHSCPVLQATSYGELKSRLAAATKRLYVIDQSLLRESVRHRPTRVVNSAYTQSGQPLGYGGRRKGYGIGWTLPLSYFAEHSQKLAARLSHCVGGRYSMENVEVFVSRPQYGYLVFPPKNQLRLEFDPT